MKTLKQMIAVAAGLFVVASTSAATITDFNGWTLVQDPPHAFLTGSVDSSSQIRLRATAGPISSGTDIGYQSINGTDAASSTGGWVFDTASDFSVAVDFNLSFGSPVGGFSIGMGIGEDQNGANSAGVTLLTMNGSPSPSPVFLGAARINDVTQGPVSTGVLAQNSGRFIVSYTAASGDVAAGVSINGDDTPEGVATFTGIQNSWQNQPLMASFFARGDNGVGAWNSGSATATFSGFHVISGTPVQIPEPSSIALMTLGLAVLPLLRRRASTQ